MSPRAVERDRWTDAIAAIPRGETRSFGELALLAGRPQIRDVIAFPKTTTAQDLMTDSPSAVDADQLADLGLKIIPPK